MSTEENILKKTNTKKLKLQLQIEQMDTHCKGEVLGLWLHHFQHISAIS
jgi:hypothetical protein